MEGKMRDIEMKKIGLQKAIVSVLGEWKDLHGLLDTKIYGDDKCENPMSDKCKQIDLNGGPCEVDLAEVLETENKKLKEWIDRKGKAEVLREIEGKMREIEFNRRFIEERAKELEVREKEIDEGFKDLEVKRKMVAEKSQKVDERAKELAKELATRHKELRKQKIDNGYKDLEVKMMEVAEKSAKADELVKELELRKKEIDDEYKDLEAKKMEVAEKIEKADAKLIEFEEQKLKQKEWCGKFEAELVKIEVQKLKLEEREEKINSREKEVERLQVLCEQRFEEIAGKTREVDSSRKLLEQNAKELELKRKELYNGFKEMGSKKMVLTQMTDKVAATNFSYAETSTAQAKRKRSSYNLRCRTPARTECPAPQVHQIVTNKNSDGGETFWTRCNFCQYQFMYRKSLLNVVLKCNHCSNCYIAHELNANSTPAESEVPSAKHMKLSANNDKIPDVNMNQMTIRGHTSADGSDTRAAIVIYDSESNRDQGLLPSPTVVDCPDPEFSDFDKDKNENCFSVDQIWACYDSLDVMPILYGHIRKVSSPDFKLQVTFLKPDPDVQSNINWVNAGLPMVCGNFIHDDDTIETSNRGMFSHQVHFQKGSDDGTYSIYPRKGETWALFKDWNIGWSSDPENHRTFRYLMVEILSDFKPESGVEICYLEKVEGFVSVFRRVVKDGIVAFLVPSSEMLRFSHSVPSTKLTGAEREGVPAEAFELDPASLPVDPSKLAQPAELEWKPIP